MQTHPRFLTSVEPNPYSHLVEEVAASINLNGVNYAVMMTTPDNFEDFVIGFLFGEGIIQNDRDVHDIGITEIEDGYLLDVTLANRCLFALKQRKRRLVGATGCGICGVEAMGHALPDLPKLAPTLPLELNNLNGLKAQIDAFQVKAKHSGAIHAAFALSSDGNIFCCREDIGRHNALDKLIGSLLRQSPTDNDMHCDTLLITSRLSSELIQKAVRYGASNLISLASPSQLAVKLAMRYHLNLIHIPKFDPPIYYTNATPEIVMDCGERYACSY
ncbi:formate dehydrogenase accessory sulfurtransferase FdhD [Shewanella sp. A25]|nr:formate dehydrogenase accessory sulfurtransferase FdhD [Shewanella shenzhenensis]